MAASAGSLITESTAVRVAQQALKNVDPKLVIDGIWGRKTAKAYANAPEFLRGIVSVGLKAAGIDVDSVMAVLAPANVDLGAIVKSAMDRGITGYSLVNFLTTLRAESGFKLRRESHLYRDPARARETFGALRGWSDRAILDLVASGPYPFFETVYGRGSAKGRALGNTEEGDGFNFRGNSLFQITGRDIHAAFQRDTGVKVLTDPDVLVRDMEAALESAVWYWRKFVVSRKADLDIVSATKVVNPGLRNVADRIALSRTYAVYA